MQKFGDGNMADVFRIGDVVRKERGPWWDSVRQVLTYLEHAGFAWSPRIAPEQTNWVDLSYIEGESIEAGLSGARDPDILRQIGRCARDLHDSLDGFRLNHETETVPWPIEPPAQIMICHNDLSPWNTVMKNGRIQGIIDWDLVSYGTREWELAWMCWRWAPIYPPGARTQLSVAEQIQRCRILLESYGVDTLDLNGFVNLIDRRMECALEVVEQLGAQGVAGFDRLLNSGMHLSGHDDRAWLASNRDLFVAGLESTWADA